MINRFKNASIELNERILKPYRTLLENTLYILTIQNRLIIKSYSCRELLESILISRCR
ncbi:MAG: hypothetical protein QXT88_03915 [Desulfurococcaceae archaeon]